MLDTALSIQEIARLLQGLDGQASEDLLAAFARKVKTASRSELSDAYIYLLDHYVSPGIPDPVEGKAWLMLIAEARKRTRSPSELIYDIDD